MAKEEKNTNVGKNGAGVGGKPVGTTGGDKQRATPSSTIELGRQSGGNPIVIVDDQADSSSGDSGDSSNSGSGEGSDSDNK